MGLYSINIESSEQGRSGDNGEVSDAVVGHRSNFRIGIKVGQRKMFNIRIEVEFRWCRHKRLVKVACCLR